MNDKEKKNDLERKCVCMFVYVCVTARRLHISEVYQLFLQLPQDTE